MSETYQFPKPKSFEEMAEFAIVCSLPASDIENLATSRRTKKAVKLREKIIFFLEEAYKQGRADERLACGKDGEEK